MIYKLRGANKAFTIIETILFVAISSLMILVAMSSIGSSQENVQFTDSMRSLQSFIETQNSAATSGVNDNYDSSVTCGDECVVLGRVIVFEENSSRVQYRTLLGNRQDYEDEKDCTSSLLQCASPLLETNVRVYDLVWGAEFTEGAHTLAGAAADYSTYSQAFGLIRSPRASSTSGITYTSTVANTAADVLAIVDDASANSVNYNPSNGIIATGEDAKAYYCFKSANGRQKAVLVIEGSQTDLVFDVSSDFTYSCS